MGFDPFGAAVGIIGDVGSDIARQISQDNATKENERFQEEMAKHGLGWKLEDAEKHGISPLYAVGAPTVAGSASDVGTDFTGMSHMGQDLLRARTVTQTPLEREQVRLLHSQVKGQDIENDLKASQLAKLRGVGAPQPEIQGESTYRVSADGRHFSVNPNAYGAAGAWRNLVEPALSGKAIQIPAGAPKPPEGYYWEYNPITFGYDAKPGGSSNVGPGLPSGRDFPGLPQN